MTDGTPLRSRGTGEPGRMAKVVEAVMVAAGAFLLGVAVVGSAAFVMGQLGYRDLVTNNVGVRLVLSVVLLQGITFGGVALGYLRLRGLGLDFIRARRPSIRDVAWMIGGFLLLVATAAVVSQALSESGIESARNQIEQQGKQNPEVLLLMIPLAFLLIGPGEELLFRGIIQGSLEEAFTPIGAIGVTSLVFAVGHYMALTGGGSKLVYLAVVFVLSLILGWTYEDTDNLVVPAVIHGGYNALIFTSMYVSATM